jgi:hypothetical protein
MKDKFGKEIGEDGSTFEKVSEPIPTNPINRSGNSIHKRKKEGEKSRISEETGEISEKRKKIDVDGMTGSKRTGKEKRKHTAKYRFKPYHKLNWREKKNLENKQIFKHLQDQKVNTKTY